MTKLQEKTKNNEGYKKTKLGWIPEDWQEVRLGEIFDYIFSYSFSRSQLNYDTNNIMCIHYGDIHSNFPKIVDVEKEKNNIPKLNTDIEINNDYFLKDGDLIIADASEDYEGVGKSILITNSKEHKIVSGLHTFVFRDNKNLTNKLYRGYFLYENNTKNKIRKIATGASVLGISKTNLSKIKISLPPVKEQEIIADILSGADEVIEATKEKIKLLKRRKNSLMQKLLAPQSHWVEKKLGSIGTFISGVGFSENEQGGQKGIPFYKVSDMNLASNEIIMTNSNNYVSLDQITRLKYKVIDKPSIIFAKVGAAIFLERKRIAKDFLLDNNMMSFTSDINIYLMKNLFDTIRLSKFAQTGALPAYNAGDLRSINISIPPTTEEQEQIASVLSTCDEEIKLYEQKLQMLEKQKKGLMQKLLTGTWRVQVS